MPQSESTAVEQPAKPALQPKKQKLMVTKTMRVSTISGVLIFKQGKTFDDPALTAMIVAHDIPHFVVPEKLPAQSVPAASSPDTHA